MAEEVRSGRESRSSEEKKAAGSLEWWEVPDRFRRPALDQAECEKIDSGGAGIIWK